MTSSNYYVLPIFPTDVTQKTNKKRLQSKRNRFSTEEDKRLKALVQEHGTKNWRTISQRMENRSPRQCRERYNNYLSENAKNGTWTAEEEALLEEKHNKYGSRWSLISEFFYCKSDANIKNHWTQMTKRKKREQEKICSQCVNDQIEERKDTNLMEWNPAIDLSQASLESLYYEW